MVDDIPWDSGVKLLLPPPYCDKLCILSSAIRDVKTMAPNMMEEQKRVVRIATELDVDGTKILFFDKIIELAEKLP